MEEQGLGAPQVAQGQGNGQLEDVLVQIIQLLEQGVTPEELVAQGVPAELVQQAIQIMQSQSQAPVAEEQVPMQAATQETMGL